MNAMLAYFIDSVILENDPVRLGNHTYRFGTLELPKDLLYPISYFEFPLNIHFL